MQKADLKSILERPETLAAEIKDFVSSDPRSIKFRADLAGLLVISMAVSYETCVKEILMSFATRHHIQFGMFAQNHFSKLNSRVALSDLYSYARTFDGAVHQKFGLLLKKQKAMLELRIGRDINASYTQILDWRHAFAHAGTRNTTVEEAPITHLLAKRVIYAFGDAFR